MYKNTCKWKEGSKMKSNFRQEVCDDRPISSTKRTVLHIFFVFTQYQWCVLSVCVIFLHYCWVTVSKQSFCWVFCTHENRAWHPSSPNVPLWLTVIHHFYHSQNLFFWAFNISYYKWGFWPKLSESGRHSDRFVVRNSFSLCENKNKLAGAMLRISDMWFPV